MDRILVTGASGQIGSELTPKLRERCGRENVVASDIRETSGTLNEKGPFENIDVTEKEEMERTSWDEKRTESKCIKEASSSYSPEGN